MVSTNTDFQKEISCRLLIFRLLIKNPTILNDDSISLNCTNFTLGRDNYLCLIKFVRFNFVGINVPRLA